MTTKNKPKGFLIILVEQALNLWITSKCNSSKELKLDISANNFDLLKGKLKHISISSIDLDFKDLIFSKIELDTSSINFKIGKGKNFFNFEEAFFINIKCWLSSNQLKRILITNRWNWFSLLLQKNILSSDKLHSIEIVKNLLELKFIDYDKNLEFTNNVVIYPSSGGLYFKNIDIHNKLRIPIEDSICIKEIKLLKNKIFISGQAKIFPD